ncbi:MAG: arginine--tRNA ligase [Patescibacteria group bacterium]
MKNEIIEALKRAVCEVTGLEVEQGVKRVANEVHGDYSSNVAMAIFAKSKIPTSLKLRGTSKNQKFENPLELAGEIVKILTISYKLSAISRVEAVAPGFINFWLSQEYLISQLKEKKVKPKKAGKKLMVEFAHPNTHKEFHIGHLRNIAIGESVCRLLEYTGNEIFRTNYQGDIGLHVAKALWGIFHLCHAEFISASQILENEILKRVQDDNLNKKVEFLGQAYAKGAKAYEEDEVAKKEIVEINASLYKRKEKYQKLWEETRQWSLDYFEEMYKRLGSHFDRLFFESEVYEKGKEIVESNIGNGIFIKDQGAVIFDGEKYGLHKRVFITKEGFATYEGKEMALAVLEFAEFPFDLAVHVVAHEQAGYFKVVFKALELIDKKFKDRQKHLSYGMVELKEGKMSSREGNIVTGAWLLDEAKTRIKKEFPQMPDDTAEMVAVGAVKYSMLKYAVASNISFSFDESISLEGNSGPYLQYAYARTQSILAKLKNSCEAGSRSARQMSNVKLEAEEISLLRTIYHFPDIVEEAAENYAPNLLCNYLFDLAQKFNLFYQKHKVIGSQNQEFRLELIRGVGEIIKTGLHLLGIQSPEKM